MLSAFRKGGKVCGEGNRLFSFASFNFFWGGQVFTVSGSRGSSRF